MQLLEKTKQLPECPGVYIMKDSSGIVIYVGKSKNLRKRVASYFSGSDNYSPKLEKLMRNINDFEHITTDTEFEALMLECRLIQEYKPAYNRQMKSPVSYCYVKISIQEELPKVEIVHEKDRNERSLYFGPYNNKNTLVRAIETAKESVGIFCNPQIHKATPCINQELGLCNGICIGITSVKEYQNSIHKLISLLDGSSNEMIDSLSTKMEAASESFDFEAAATLRDKLKALRYASSKAKIKQHADQLQKLILLEHISNKGIKLFTLSNNEIQFSKLYDLQDKNNLIEDAMVQAEILLRSTVAPTDEKLAVDKAHILYAYLKKPSETVRYLIIDDTLNTTCTTGWLNNTVSKWIRK